MSAESGNLFDRREVRRRVMEMLCAASNGTQTTEQAAEDAATLGLRPEWLAAQFVEEGWHEFIRRCAAACRDERGRRAIEIATVRGLDGEARQLLIHESFSTPEWSRAILRDRHRGLRADVRRARDVIDKCRERHEVNLLDDDEFAPWRPVYDAFSAIPDDPGYTIDPESDSDDE